MAPVERSNKSPTIGSLYRPVASRQTAAAYSNCVDWQDNTETEQIEDPKGKSKKDKPKKGSKGKK